MDGWVSFHFEGLLYIRFSRLPFYRGSCHSLGSQPSSLQQSTYPPLRWKMFFFSAQSPRQRLVRRRACQSADFRADATTDRADKPFRSRRARAIYVTGPSLALSHPLNVRQPTHTHAPNGQRVKGKCGTHKTYSVLWRGSSERKWSGEKAHWRHPSFKERYHLIVWMWMSSIFFF